MMISLRVNKDETDSDDSIKSNAESPHDLKEEIKNEMTDMFKREIKAQSEELMNGVKQDNLKESAKAWYETKDDTKSKMKTNTA